MAAANGSKLAKFVWQVHITPRYTLTYTSSLHRLWTFRTLHVDPSSIISRKSYCHHPARSIAKMPEKP